MKFWPVSSLLENSLITPALAYGMNHWAKTGHAPEQMFQAMAYLARCTVPKFADGLQLVRNVGSPDRRLFADYPASAEFADLERVCVFELDDGRMLAHVDALH